jgi:hypothetical protein
MKKLKTASLLTIFAVILSAGAAHNAAFAATQPYVAGYATTSTVTIHTQYTMDVNFTNVSGPRNVNLAHVFSTAGFASTSSTDPTGWEYQHIVDVHTDDHIYGEQQVWQLGTCIFNCPVSSSNWTQLGHMGTASPDIKFVYSTFYWNTGKTGVNFYYEPHFNNGSSSSAPITTYTKGMSDTSNYFATGTKSKTVSGTTYLFKFFQFGVESSDPLTVTWNAWQYSMTYAGTSQYSALTTASTTVLASDPTNTSAITYSGTTPIGVGGSKYSANADYHHLHSSVPSGTVKWYYSSTAITPGTQLWP